MKEFATNLFYLSLILLLLNVIIAIVIAGIEEINNYFIRKQARQYARELKKMIDKTKANEKN